MGYGLQVNPGYLLACTFRHFGLEILDKLAIWPRNNSKLQNLRIPSILESVLLHFPCDVYIILSVHDLCPLTFNVISCSDIVKRVRCDM